MVHANARLTVHGRRLIVERCSNGWKQAHVADAMGCARKTVAYWLARFRAEGDDGLFDRSTAPKSSPNKTPQAIEADVVRLRVEERLGRDEVAERVGVSPRTASRIIARHGLPPLSALDPMTGAVIRASKQTFTRYERERPGELAHMDVKKLGRIPDGGGWRVHGRGAGSILRDRNTKVGFDYVHSLVDDRTRLAYSEVLPDEKGATCAAFLQRGIDYFLAHGIARVERLMTDNAWAYKHSLRTVCQQHEIRQVFIRPHCPWQNGKVERFNRTLQTEWAYRQPFVTNDERTAALAPWLEHYNTRRRHSALGRRPPTSLLPPMS